MRGGAAAWHAAVLLQQALDDGVEAQRNLIGTPRLAGSARLTVGDDPVQQIVFHLRAPAQPRRLATHRIARTERGDRVETRDAKVGHQCPGDTIEQRQQRRQRLRAEEWIEQAPCRSVLDTIEAVGYLQVP